ncbi:split zinc finger protein [Scheffersomyces xylosifermentans]|uniref:split zinc finger protein n=1 Tax=Scheffersomyces xylosifermentans TaxID=1304137 RepID=UPI00315DA0EC
MFNTKIFDGTPSGSPAINIPNPSAESASNTNSGTSSSSILQPIDITYQRQSIFNNSRFRRESIAHSQGMGGVSWGSITIGSWLKDEVMMNSNYNSYSNMHGHQNSNNNLHPNQNNGNLINPRRGSFRHGNNNASANNANANNINNVMMSMSPPLETSYLPDLEADYCKDYSCCGELLPTLHDLLRHYEEAHISPSPPPDSNHLLSANRNRNNFNNMHNIMETVSTTDVFLNNTGNAASNTTTNYQFQTQQNNNNNQPPHQILNSHHQQLSNIPNGNNNLNQPPQQISNPSLNLHNSHYNIQPQTISQNAQLGNVANNGLNGITSIPTNQLQNLQQQQLQQQNHMQQQNQHHQHVQQQSAHINPPRSSTPMQGEDEDSMYIDDPARHLYVMENDEHKPFKCPVIGCEKTYKNQNGLKYHRSHGHQGQTLKENPDGTISIIDPESNTPYLDGAGMEKDKPYRCEVCGKRYKNLNGLKYHRGHTTH